MTLYDECIEALGVKCILLDLKSTNKKYDKFREDFPMSKWGGIDWEKSEALLKRALTEEVFDLLIKENTKFGKVIVFWDNAELPALVSDLDTLMKNIYDVLAVSFDTWFYFEEDGEVIEFHHDKGVTKGRIRKG